MFLPKRVGSDHQEGSVKPNQLSLAQQQQRQQQPRSRKFLLHKWTGYRETSCHCERKSAITLTRRVEEGGEGNEAGLSAYLLFRGGSPRAG